VLAFAVGFASQTMRLRKKTLEGSRLVGTGIYAGLSTLVLASLISVALLTWDRGVRFNYFRDPEGLSLDHPWQLAGMVLDVLFNQIGIKTWAQISYEDICVKPSTWTGLARNSETELALTKGVQLSYRSLHRLYGWYASFCKAKMNGVEMDSASVSQADFRGVHFTSTKARGTNFVSCNFTDRIPSFREVTGIQQEIRDKFHSSLFDACKFDYSNFAEAYLSMVDAHGTTFKECSFFRTIFLGANFEYCDFGGAFFRESDCRKSHFKDCVLRKAFFNLANCEDAIFENVLGGCEFYGARLDRAKIAGDVRDVNFTDAWLVETNLSEATGLTEDQLKKAKTLYHVKLPNDLAAKLSDLVNKEPPPESVLPQSE
jgi:uncharacterized protein YjbI with pentapeptide repeats